MMDWPNHEEPWREWRDAMEGTRMHHGWMLAGMKGLGKREFALQAARELVNEEAIPQPLGDHPDVLILAKLPKDEKEEKKRDDGKPFETKRNISVAQIRAMQRRLTTRPTLGSRRAIIINPADDMEAGASNALLKSLEEPPRGTFFLLVTHRPSRLLPTIRSRCRILRFPTISDANITRMLGSDADQAAVKAACLAARGSFGTAQRFLAEDLAPIAAVIGKLLDDGDPQFVDRGELARLIGGRPSRERIQAVLELAQAIVAAEAPNANGARRLALIDAHTDLVALAGQAPTFNFDPGLLAMEIGTLLTRPATASEPANA
ncbi:MAG: DNA polymerase III subunit delta' [Pseudomonadota bacterium]